MDWTWLVPIVSSVTGISIAIDVWRDYRSGELNGPRAISFATVAIATSAAGFKAVGSPLFAGSLLAAYAVVGASVPIAWLRRKRLPKDKPPDQIGSG